MADQHLWVENDGQAIRRTNYWQMPYNRAGKFFLSINAGAFRLLVPTSQEGVLRELRTATHAVISFGPMPSMQNADMFELLFDDGTDDPFSLHLSAQAADRLPAREDEGRVLTLTVWMHRVGLTTTERLRLRCGYRRSYRLPDLRAWGGLEPLP